MKKNAILMIVVTLFVAFLIGISVFLTVSIWSSSMPTWLKVILTLGRRRSLLGLLLFILFILIIALIYFLLEKWIQFQDWLSEKKRKK